VDLGKFVTHIGGETIETVKNWNYSHAFFYTYAIPFQDTGARLNYNWSDTLYTEIYVVNGWNVTHDNNSGRTWGPSVGWTKNYPELGAAYSLKEGFYGIYEGSGSPQAAIAAYEAWNKAVVPEVRDAYSDLIRAWTKWQPWILGYFDHPVTNAYTESLNSLIRVMNRLGRGYSFEALRAKILFTEGAHKKTLAKPKFERRREPVVMDFAADDVMGYGVPGQGTEGLARMMVGTPGKKAETHETGEPAKNFGADITTLTELIESGKL
jgi:transposase